MTYDVQAAIAAEVATGPDMTKAVAGGVREIAKAGPTRLRFVGYIEIGKHQGKGKAATKQQDKVQLVFELSGKNHPPREFDGKKFPQAIVITETKSLNEKANFFKLFSKMNWAGKATHMAQLLGDGFLGEVSHYTFKGSTGDDVTIAQLRADGAYNINKPFRTNDEDETVAVKIDEPMSAIRFFAWNTATKEQWDSLFIDGEYEATEGKDGQPGRPAKSKNVIQNTIKLALNFKGSKIEEVLKLNGLTLDVPDADVPTGDIEMDLGDDEVTETKPGKPVVKAKAVPKGKAADDVLNGVV